MKKLMYVIILIMSLSCTKEQFQTNKSSQSSAITAVNTSSTTVCSQSTLVKPKVDILMVWDNTSSFNFVTTDSKLALSNLISSVSEKFDYHIITTPLVPANSAPLFETTLMASDPTSVTGNATYITQSKEAAIAALGFTQGQGSAEMGIDRAYNFITANTSNGMFRTGAYTIVVLMSNEDDKGCELSTGYNSCTPTDKNNYLAPRKQKMLCLRGATSAFNCTGYPTLNSSMMRFITIAPLTACSNGLNKINYNYKTLSQYIYSAPYNNGWPTSSDDLSSTPDSRDLCAVDFSHIFDSVNTAIKQTLIKHVYSYWPVAATTASVDPQTLIVTRDDGKVLTNNTDATNPSNGYVYIGAQVNQATRTYPTAGEYFTGKMIQLLGTNDNDLIIYPHCLTVTYQEVKSKYGYIYLQNGQPVESTIEVTKTINGVATIIPKDNVNGWSYMGLQFTNALDSTLKAANLPAGTNSGYFIKLNGTAQLTNATNVSLSVLYTSAATP